MTIDLRLGRWQDALSDVDGVDAVITDPPYLGACVDANGGAFRGAVTQNIATKNREQVMGYKPASEELLAALCVFAKRCKGWCVFFNDFDGAHFIRAELLRAGAVVAEPIAWVKPGALTPARGGVILPQKGTEFIVCARFVRMKKWHTHLVGHYAGPAGASAHHQVVTGGKPLGLMRAIVRDYSRPGDLVCDPCAGGGTTLLAAAAEGRRAVGAEMDPVTHAKATARIARGYTPLLFPGL